ncbi:unnamed protein product [Ascophyllum nodosum]
MYVSFCSGWQHECSYHQGNRFISLHVRVFEPPPKGSGQLLDSDSTISEKIEGGWLVEVQLREGDRLHFSCLFREFLTNFSEVRSKEGGRTFDFCRVFTEGCFELEKSYLNVTV